MTQEEFYIWLLNYGSNSDIDLPNFNPESLKNYEIVKLFLEKIGTEPLSKKQQKNLNPEAVSAWFNSSEYIDLQYDIPEILELLPERIGGSLYLQDSQIESLPSLKSVGGSLYLQNSQIESLPELKYVGNYLDLRDSQIQFLPNLESVGGYFDLQNSQIESLPELRSVRGSLVLFNSQIQSLPNLESVGGDLDLYKSQIQSLPELKYVGTSIIVGCDQVEHWKKYFNETGRSDLANKVSVG